MISGKELLFGKIALREGLLTAEQLNEALTLQEATGFDQPLGEILVILGHLTKEDIGEILKIQKGSKEPENTIEDFRSFLFGSLAVENRYCSSQELHDSLRIQAKIESSIPLSLGEIMVRKGYLTQEQVYKIIKEQQRKVYYCTHCGIVYNFVQLEIDGRIPLCKKCNKPMEPSEQAVSGKVTDVKTKPRSSKIAIKVLKNIHETRTEELIPVKATSTSAVLQVITEFEQQDKLKDRGTESLDERSSAELEVYEGSPELAPKSVQLEGGEPTSDAEGKRLGLYVITKELGRGGMGVVYQARNVNEKEARYAIKFIRRDLSTNELYHKRFQREISLVMSLAHENVTNMIETGVKDGFQYLVMEYIDGENLVDILEREDKLGLNRAVEIIKQASKALSHAHKNNIVHRDMKPDNIIISRLKNSSGEVKEVVKITDFGLAKDLSGLDDTLTLTGQLIGTPHYMSPEQCRGEYSDQRSDIYSLGCTFYHLICGKPPFDSDNYLAVMEMQKNDPIVPPEQLNPAVPRSISFIIGKMMEKNPDHRYPTMVMLLRHLEMWDSDQLLQHIKEVSAPFAKVRSFGKTRTLEKEEVDEKIDKEFDNVKTERDRMKIRIDRLENVLHRARDTRKLLIALAILFLIMGIIIGLLLAGK